MSKKSDPWFRNRAIRDAIYHSIYDAMKDDPSIYIMGEGSHMKVRFDCPAIERDFPERVITLPISEDANTNFALGMALAGVKPIVDVITADFLYRTMDSVCNTVAKTNFVQDPRTIIIRAEFMTAGPTTGQRPEALFTHIPGLNVVIPSNPVDAKGLMDSALEEKACTLFFEDRMIEDATTRTSEEDNEENERTVPLGRAINTVFGNKLTVVSYGLTYRMLSNLFRDMRPECNLIDLRSIYPIDFDLIKYSVSRTDALLIVEPDVGYMGVGAEIAAEIGSWAFGKLRHPVRRMGAPRTNIPASRGLHDSMLPSIEGVMRAAEEMAR